MITHSLPSENVYEVDTTWGVIPLALCGPNILEMKIHGRNFSKMLIMLPKWRYTIENNGFLIKNNGN